MASVRANQPNGPAIAASPGFAAWLGEAGISLFLTSAPSAVLMMIGRRADGALWGQMRRFAEPRGLWANGDQIWLGTRAQIWSLSNVLPAGGTFKENGADRLYCPRVGFMTDDAPAHEIALDTNGRAIFVNARFSCLASPDMRASFRPVWKPGFISALRPENRCHLTGVALEYGAARFVTAYAQSDERLGWQSASPDAGIVISVREDETAASGLSMPHSPRVHDGKLWLLNSGTCEFGHVDLSEGRFVPACFCPGFARGLAFAGNFAIVALSHLRETDAAGSPRVREILEQRTCPSQCGIMVVDLKRGEPVHWLRFGTAINEISDLQAVSRVRQPAALGFAAGPVLNSGAIRNASAA